MREDLEALAEKLCPGVAPVVREHSDAQTMVLAGIYRKEEPLSDQSLPSSSPD